MSRTRSDSSFFFSSRRRHTRLQGDWSSDVCSSDLVVVNAHYGFYERFAPQTPTGVADPAGGIREFVAGTGGALVTPFGTVRPNSEVRNSGTFGVLNLTLGDGSYSWQFVPVAGKTFTDNGTTACHGARPTVSGSPDITTNPGDTVTLSASFTDPDPSDGPWGYTVHWGDEI